MYDMYMWQKMQFRYPTNYYDSALMEHGGYIVQLNFMPNNQPQDFNVVRYSDVFNARVEVW